MFLFHIRPSFVFVFALVLLMLCCAGKYSTAGAACAPHARPPTTAAARGKNSTPATRLNFAQKMGSSLEMGLSVGPISAKFCATWTRGAFSMTWEDLGWRESWDGSGGWCWWVGGCCLSELRRPLVRIWWTRPGSSRPPVRTCNIFVVLAFLVVVISCHHHGCNQ